MSVLVIDVGTTGLRSSIVRADGAIEDLHYRPVDLHRPTPGLVEFDPAQLAQAALETARDCLQSSGSVQAVAITNQRASTVLWDRTTHEVLGPGLGWQDLRTTGQCLALKTMGLHLAPNQSATKLSFLLDKHDPSRQRDLCFGTIDSFLAFVLTDGAIHVTDASNAAVTGLVRHDASDWDDEVLEKLRIPPSILPQIVNSIGALAPAVKLPGAPMLSALIGDQQSSLVGQGAITTGLAKATFGTGGMLDVCLGENRPTFDIRGDAGTFPIVAWRQDGKPRWGLEAIMLSAGSCLSWLTNEIGLLNSVAESDAIAASVRNSAGVSFVPALGGLGTPVWDFGARGTLAGLSSATTRAEIVHAVLEGIAHRGADLLESAEQDAGFTIEQICLDGGMSKNVTFVSLLASATQRPVVLSNVVDATTLGAGFLAGVAVNTWSSLEETSALIEPRAIIEPGRRLDRDLWFRARDHARSAVPALSALHF